MKKNIKIINAIADKIYTIKRYNIELLAYVIMPNHVHLIVNPPDGLNIGKVIGELKFISARQIINYFEHKNSTVLDKLVVLRNREKKRAVWMRRCYDHNCLTEDTVLEKINYCHNNPVKWGLVNKIEDYKWSSYKDYIKNPTAPK